MINDACVLLLLPAASCAQAAVFVRGDWTTRSPPTPESRVSRFH